VIDDDLRGVAIVLILLFAVMAIGIPYYSSRTVEPFSELGILGPNKQIADYPTSVATGENFTLYLYVGNHQGQAEYYQVYAKLGTQASVVSDNVSLAVAPLKTYGMVLLNNQTYLQPISLHLNQPGQNVRLVFELWIYQANSSSFVYDHRFNQIFLNVSSI
jgi:uncharacterized membrane protein